MMFELIYKHSEVEILISKSIFFKMVFTPDQYFSSLSLPPSLFPPSLLPEFHSLHQFTKDQGQIGRTDYIRPDEKRPG